MPTNPTEEMGECVCAACGERFESEEALDRHVRDAGLVD